ncbi:hypothetical protein M422DRAFT_32454 [Sphaerobolus stellatus SS14]|uniref:RING-type E3 ubiquitin transferase n=1 Tax=Sphaerobolus stellatus (strain SS14) TaxID=990650 RepID=A0A0C9VPR9_SPHS4|nr:hypothetical protein M422DRAFT_32454 [Sphaerobolus stellatus SS14]
MPRVQDILRPYTHLAASNRLLLYAVFSTSAVSLVIFNAFWNFSNFYSIAVYLSRSNRSVLVLANFGLLCSLLVGRVLQQVFFGSLRTTEVERLYDKIWFFLTESLLAFTIFRDEFDVSFGVMFGFLLFVKCFHWLMSFRIEWMDQIQYPGPNVWFHIRMNVLFFSLWCLDIVMICFAVENILTHGIGGIILFASEYAILIASLLNSMAKYLIIFYDIRRAGRNGGENAPIWEDKSMYIFYVELATDFLKLITYLVFFLVVLTYYGLPLNIIRDIYITARSFFQRCRDLVRYRTATRNMDERYPNATAEELNLMNDRTCIICREEMVARDPAAPAAERPQAGINDTPKKLPCGHVFHFHCLRSWLERQQSCPTCRRNVLETRQAQPNGQARGQGPAAPQLGAIPQLQGFGGAQPPQGQGRLARWLGLPVAPPIVPGQFAGGPQGFNQLPNQIPLQDPGQNPFGPWQQPGFYAPQQQQQQQQPPAPVQVLQGFYLGNQWQPWGQPQQQLEQAQRPQPQAPEPPQAQPVPAARPPTPVTQTDAPNSQANTSFTQTQISGAASPSNEQTSTTSSSTSGAGASDGSNLTPREAAALAALRRFGSPSTSGSIASTQTPATSSATPPPVSERRPIEPIGAGHRTDSVPSIIPLTPTPTVPGPSSTTNTQPSLMPANGTTATSSTTRPESASTAPQPQSQAQPRPPRGAVPSLIPLFDPASTHATIVPPPNVNYTRPPNNQYPGYGSSYRTPRTYNLVGSGQLPDLRTLPQTLTEEQLDRLDTLTREAIDERLRALENIQGVMWRCSEELIRIRSVLPVRAGPATAGPSQSQASPSGQNAEASGSATSTAGVQVSSSQISAASQTQARPSSAAAAVQHTDAVVPAAVAVEPEQVGPTDPTAAPAIPEPFTVAPEP